MTRGSGRLSSAGRTFEFDAVGITVTAAIDGQVSAMKSA
jgi:hypothetical protein